MKFDYLFDLHTASAGRQNSLYVRANMANPEVNRIARSLGSQIIVHNSSPGGSLRGCAQEKGIKALTIEACQPSPQRTVQHTLTGTRSETLAFFRKISFWQP
jgi:predicted deacylase